MLEARNLEATRGGAMLFSGLAFTLRPGALLRVSGANGTGKTSLLRVLCGLAQPSAGEVRWNGTAIRALGEEYWKHVAYVGHANALKDELTVAENLESACALAGLDAAPARVQAAIGQFELAARAQLPVKLLSQGQRRRAALARLALSEAVPLWILDEPFAALDAGAIERVQSVAQAHLARGGMVVLTTHQDARIEAQSAADINLDRPSLIPSPSPQGEGESRASPLPSGEGRG
jgi:heme exporter protein A